jgi:hypothetical protein
MFNPELVALAPSTSCRKTGRKVIAPNIAKPITKPTPLATLNTWMRKSRKGSIGSLTRRSTTTNPASITTPMIPRAKIGSESHAYCVPPQVVIRISAEAPAARKNAPSQSMLCEMRRVGVFNTVAVTNSAIAAIGTLM